MSNKDLHREPIIRVGEIEYSHINLYRITEKDDWSLCDFVVSNEDQLKAFFPETREQNLTPELSNYFTQKKSKEFDLDEEYLYTLKSENSRKILGLVYIKELKWDIQQAELAYCIDYSLEGKGVTSQMINTIVDYAFGHLKFKTLQIIVHKENIASVKVAIKNNFIWQKTLLKSFAPKGMEPMDMELYERYN